MNNLPAWQFRTQYACVQESREILLQYCSRISPEHFVAAESIIGRGSVRNLLIHIANVYEFWIASKALHKLIAFTSFESVRDIQAVRIIFERVDGYMDEFFSLIDEVNPEFMEFERNELPFRTTPVRLFTHVITHEYHHKGQLLSLSRLLGYFPVDTDIIR